MVFFKDVFYFNMVFSLNAIKKAAEFYDLS